MAAATAVAAIVSADPSRAQGRDLFSSFFNALIGRGHQPALDDREARTSAPFVAVAAQAPSANSSRSAAYCVRTCDGRYFPVDAGNEQSRAATCNSLCPASETKVFYGSTIDQATSENGKPYSSLPNAFKYREKLVPGCTCNGNVVGLASIDINDDKTIRKGDIVAGKEGLIVANRNMDRRSRRTARFSPAPAYIRQKFERAHAMMRP